MTDTEDILESWKNSKFVMVDFMDVYCTVILTDLDYWITNWDDLIEWGNKNNCTVQGMTVTIPDEKTQMLFALRWS